MARVPYINQDDLQDKDKELLERPANVFRAIANSPDLLRAYLNFGYWMRFDSELDQRLRELAILQIGYLQRSDYEWSHHIKIGYDFAVTDDDIAALIDETEGRTSSLGELERLVLLGTREVVESGRISDSTWSGLSKHWGNDRLVEFVMVVTFNICVGGVLANLDVEVEPEYEQYLEKFPLPGSSRS